jgi:hemerythrin-like metal-binding protein
VQRKNLSTSGRDILDNLKRYTVSHFNTEEHYFSRSGYPDTEQHKQIHRKFEDKVATVDRQFSAGQTHVGADLLDFLKDWLLSHIRVTDHQYAPFVKSFIEAEERKRGGAGAGATPKKRDAASQR